MKPSTYPSWYSEKDKMMFDEMMVMGQSLIGTKIKKSEDFLIELSARLTINQLNNREEQFSVEEIEELKKTYKDLTLNGLVYTPEDIQQGDKLKLSNGELFNNPLSKPPQEYYNDNIEEKKNDLDNIINTDF
jgi:hypothetical protein